MAGIGTSSSRNTRRGKKIGTTFSPLCGSSALDFNLYAVGQGVADGHRIYAYEDDTPIFRNGIPLGVLDAQQGLTVVVSPGDVIRSCKPIAGSGEEGGAHVSLKPEYLAATVLGTNVSRGGGIGLHIYSLTATSADIYRNNALVTTIALTPNGETVFNQTGNYVGAWRVEANGLILGHKRDDNNGNQDSSTMIVPAVEVFGFASNDLYLSTVNPVPVTPFTSYQMEAGIEVGTIATTYNIVNQGDFGTVGANNNFNDPRCAVRSVSGNGVELFGLSRADGDGGDDSPHTPESLFRTHHLIPQPTEYVSFISATPASIQVFDQTGALVTTINTTKTSPLPLAPFSVRYGAINNAANQAAGFLFVANVPVYCVYQPKGAGGFGSDDDETVSWGWNL